MQGLKLKNNQEKQKKIKKMQLKSPQNLEQFPLGDLLGASWASLGRLLKASWRLLGASWAHPPWNIPQA